MCGKDGLFQLCCKFHDLYAEIGERNYKRIATDFLLSHQYHDATDAMSKNAHAVNLDIMRELLLERTDLVARYFKHSDFSLDLFRQLYSDIYANPQKKKLSATSHGASASSQSDAQPCQRSLECHFTKETISLIATCANEVSLFKKAVTPDEIHSLFTSRPVHPLIARNNRRVVLFFEGLAVRNLITADWKIVVADLKLIISSSGRRYLTANDLYSTYCQSSNLTHISWFPLLEHHLDIISQSHKRHLEEEQSMKINDKD